MELRRIVRLETLHEYDNPENQIIGSKVNAYLNVNLYLKWALSPKFDLMIGATGSHFSTETPNIPTPV